MEIRDKTIVLVPASADACRACAGDLAQRGANLILVDGDADELASVAESVRKLGGKAVTLTADTTDLASLEAAAAQLQRDGLPVHALVTCYLEVDICSIERSSAQSWRRIVEVNLLGPVFASKAFLPLLKRAPGAAIVHVTSIDGILGNPWVPSFSAAKGGMSPLVHVMAEEFGPLGIRVNCVARGMTAPPEEDHNPRFAPLIEECPLGRPARPHEIAATVRFLISEDAAYITGAMIVADGGRTGITQGTRRMNMSGRSPMWKKAYDERQGETE